MDRKSSVRPNSHPVFTEAFFSQNLKDFFSYFYTILVLNFFHFFFLFLSSTSLRIGLSLRFFFISGTTEKRRGNNCRAVPRVGIEPHRPSPIWSRSRSLSNQLSHQVFNINLITFSIFFYFYFLINSDFLFYCFI